MTKDGDLVDVALVAAPLEVDGSSVGYVLSFRDISERKETEAKVQHDALFDVLTGLANRALFIDRLTLALSRRSRRRDQNCGVLLLDLDRFPRSTMRLERQSAMRCCVQLRIGCGNRCALRIRRRVSVETSSES